MKRQTQKKLTYYKQVLENMEYYNDMAPFPVFDTEYVSNMKKYINRMETKEYDKEPVVACKYCKSLHIVTDEVDNDICFRCGSVNELKEFKNIDEYLKFKNKDE